MPPDATATKVRILDAAVREFAHYGFAGARVDRIAARAEANKRSIYVHFGNKDELFDLIVATALTDMASDVPFTAADLAGYAVRLFDYLHANPHVLRLTAWAQLERPEPTPGETEVYRPKVAAIIEAQKSGDIASSCGPVDLLALIIGTTTSWAYSSPALRALAVEPLDSNDRLSRHRAALFDAVSAIIFPAATRGIGGS